MTVSLSPLTDQRTEKDFRAAVAARYLPTLLALLTDKGEQYAGNADPALINFHQGSKLAAQTPAHYLMSLATKQWCVISDWSIQADPMKVVKRELVQRIFDVCVYMFLLLFMLEIDGPVNLPGEK